MPRSPAFPGLHRSHCWAVCYWAFCFSPPAAAQQGPLLDGWQAVGGSRSVATGATVGGGGLVQRTAASGQPANLTPSKRNLAVLELRFCCTLHARQARDPHKRGLGLACFPFWLLLLLERVPCSVASPRCVVRRAACVVRDACEMRCTS